MTSTATRNSALTFEKGFTLATGSIDLLALFDALRPYPAQMQLYVQAMREMRAETKTQTANGQ